MIFYKSISVYMPGKPGVRARIKVQKMADIEAKILLLLIKASKAFL